MPIVLNGIAGITTPEIVSTGGPLVVNASAPDNSVVVDASGNVGIGTSSPNALLRVTKNQNAETEIGVTNSDTTNTSSRARVRALSGTVDTVLTSIAGLGSFVGASSNHNLHLITNGSTRALIDTSGALLVATTTAPQATSKFAVGNFDTAGANYGVSYTDGGDVFFVRSSTTISTNSAHYQFINTNGTVGGINTNGTATSFLTSSDYRLKEAIAPMQGALAKVALLKPCVYKWKVDGSNGQGFIAHELAEVEPGCVSGEKDAVDAEGNPQYQGIDTSFLVATLTAALQELKAINDAQAQTIESLTARVVALENQIV